MSVKAQGVESMKETLQKLWQDFTVSRKESVVCEEIDKALLLLEERKNKLRELLGENGTDALRSLEECYSEIELLSSKDAFVSGFSFAVKIMTESLS